METNEITLADEIILKLDMQSDGFQTTYLFDDVKKAMIEFAQLHVKKALESAADSLKFGYEANRGKVFYEAYQLENIK